MTRLAIISDIHGNLHALQAVLSRLTDLEPDQVICLGDIVGYGPYPERCLDLIVKHCSVIVQGNHDEAVVDPDRAEEFNGAAREAIYWTRDTLGPLHLNALTRLPRVAHVGDQVMCVHDSPVPGPTDYVHDKQVAGLAFAGVETAICLLGHTHVPMVFEAPAVSPPQPFTAPELVAHLPQDGVGITIEQDRRYICNPGSVGQPRDCDPRASFAMLEFNGSGAQFTVYRQQYDVAAAQMATQRAGLPTILADRLALGA